MNARVWMAIGAAALVFLAAPSLAHGQAPADAPAAESGQMSRV